MRRFFVGIITGLALSPIALHAASSMFYDVQIQDWYGPAIQRLQKHGILTGYNDGSFKPHQNVSRAELAVVVDRVLQALDTQYAEQVDDVMGVTLFFTNKAVMIERDCGATKPVLRMTLKTTAVADAALRELFKGVTTEEAAMGVTDGFSAEYLQGAGYNYKDSKDLIDYYQGVSIENGIATVKFSQGAMAYLNAAICMQQIIKAPIEQTLLQFPTVSKVQYSVDGKIITDWDA